MFTTAKARYALRATVAAGLAMLSVAGTIWIDNIYVKLASAGLGVLASYLGVGAAFPQVEPFVGNQAKSVEIPAMVTGYPAERGDDLIVKPQ